MNNKNGNDQSEKRTDAELGSQVNSRNSNIDNDAAPVANEPDVERAADSGMGDSAVNDEKLTKYTSNHSGDA